MALKEDLSRLVEKYGLREKIQVAKAHGEKKILDITQQQQLEADVIHFISLALGQGESLNKQYKKLSLLLHQDKVGLSEDISCLEMVLSSGENNGACFKYLQFCRDKLIEKTQAKPEAFQSFETTEALRDWLIKQKTESKLTIQADLYSRLIQLLDDMVAYQADVEEINNRFIRIIQLQLPLFLSAYCASFFAAEIFSIYAVGAVGMGLGKKLYQSGLPSSQFIGLMLFNLSSSISMLTSSALVVSLNTAIRVSHLALKGTCGMIRFISPGESSASSSSSASEEPPVFENRDVVAVLDEVRNYLIAYRETAAQQWGGWFRKGGRKRVCFKEAIAALDDIQISTLNKQEKVQAAQAVIEALKMNKSIYQNGKQAKYAIILSMIALSRFQAKEIHQIEQQAITCLS